MDRFKAGGNAFPHEINDGMTLRDYFAAKAMQALIADDYLEAEAIIAIRAYKFADAMLAEREKQ